MTTDNNLITTAEAAETVGVAVSTIRDWRRLGRLQPAFTDDRGQRRFRLIDVLRADRETRTGRGRPRNSTIAARRLAEIPWPLSDVDHFLTVAAEAFGDEPESGSMIRAALARLGSKGYPEGTIVPSLRRWCDSAGSLERLRDRIVDLSVREVAERAARELRTSQRIYRSGRELAWDNRTGSWVEAS